MSRINVLSSDTANKIAAGEVVERPLSVVKELVENSIDANAKNITIEIEEGGISLIKVIDDGDGIFKDDIIKAFMPHATSKIYSEEDIYNISTLGFRGEALPSIASISKVSLKTKRMDENFGYELYGEGGKFNDVEECGLNKGTVIEVRDLFYNVPARKKFLKSISRETSLINDIVTRIALANPSVSFKLINNSKKSIHTFGSGDVKEVIRNIYGANIANSTLYFEDISDSITVYGYVGKENIARGSRNNQSAFVNKRYIKNRALSVAVEQAFKSFSTVSKFPFFVLYIEIYPELVDVNIHPTKAEIKFYDDKTIFSKIFGAVHKSLKEDVFNNFKVEEEKEEYPIKKAPSFEEISFKIKEEEEKVKASANLMRQYKDEKSKVYDEEKNEVILPLDLKNDDSKSFSGNIETNTKFIDDNLHKDSAINDNTVSHKNSIINADNSAHDGINMNSMIDSNDAGVMSSDTSNYDRAHDVSKERSEEGRIAKFPPITIIGQYNKTYILGEYDGTLYMIDQHAAHEKILFERYFKGIENGETIIQSLIVPIVIELTYDDYSYYKDNTSIFENAGFVLDEFGDNTLSLKEIPYFLGKLNPKELFLEILDDLKNMGNGKTSEVKYNAIATKACKAAIKGNDKLEYNEMIKLIEDLRYIDDPFHCPHGRPAIIKFTSVDIDKKFKRIV